MIVTKLIGGLGNQMFQYALGLNLALKNKTVLKMDLNDLLDRTPKEDFIFRNYDLDIFGIKPNCTDNIEVNGLRNANSDQSQKVENLVYIERNKYIFVKEKSFIFDKSILDSPNNSYLKGYWQSEKYFIEIKEIIRKKFSFYPKLNSKYNKIHLKINSTNSVCINVRRKDYIEIKKTNKFHGVCDMNYFSKGIDLITKKTQSPHFFIFSDDIEWCKKYFINNKNTEIIEHDYAGKKFKNYLYLMINCKNFIIPNSTFGWWAAWLSRNRKKIIIAPKKWFSDSKNDTRDLIPKTWIRI